MNNLRHIDGDLQMALQIQARDPFQAQGIVLLRDVEPVLAFNEAAPSEQEMNDAWSNDMKSDPEFAAYWSKRL